MCLIKKILLLTKITINSFIGKIIDQSENNTLQIH